MRIIPDFMLTKIDDIINKYSLISDKDVFVAYSGGKDSLFLCIALRELGYKVFPVIVDIGYNTNWTHAFEIIKEYNMDALLLNNDYLLHNHPDIIPLVEGLFSRVVEIAKGNQQSSTICTPCYNAKMTILREWAEANGISQIAMGHHGTDAISSMIKSYYYYVDRWFNNNITFNYSRYCDLVHSQIDVFSLPVEEFINTNVNERLSTLLKDGFVGTDEPVAQFIADSSIKLYRPLYSLYECDIIRFYNKAEKATLIDGVIDFMSKISNTECFLANFRNDGYMTPRELIQFKLLQSANVDLMDYLLKKCTESIDEKGFLKYNVRNNRCDILGSTYKGAAEIKKL